MAWTVKVASVKRRAFRLAGEDCALAGAAFECERTTATGEAGDYGMSAQVTYELWISGTITSETTLEHTMSVDYLSCEGDACRQVGPPIPCYAEFYAEGVALD